MTTLEEAALELAGVLDELHLRYMLIGGAAVGFWGEPRATLDVDLTIWVEPDEFQSTVEAFVARFALRTAQALEIARQSRVLLIRASNGVPVDLLFASWPIEKQAIERAVLRPIGNAGLRVAPLDYLLFLKLISERPKDFADAEALMRRHRGTFDATWLESELSALSESLAQPDMLSRFQRLLKNP
ncbi:MAG TPA: nucleotidyl transferase AbiEii/AbiGii toxin family protein [Bryobacteraceae bacterium]